MADVVQHFEVSGDWRHIIEDGMVDLDALPDEVRPTGHVEFTPVSPNVSVAGVPARAYTLGTDTGLIADGVLVDMQGRDGVRLAGQIGEVVVRWHAKVHLEYRGQVIDYPDVEFDLSGPVRLTGLIRNDMPGSPPWIVDPRIEGLIAAAEAATAGAFEARDEARDIRGEVFEARDAAAGSASAAAGSATAAAGSASEAGDRLAEMVDVRSAAVTARDEAVAAKGAAFEARDEAIGARNAAGGFADNAAGSASNAAGSASAAAGSAAAAAGSATAAAGSASDAASTLAAVLAALANAEGYQDVVAVVEGLSTEWRSDIAAAISDLIGGADPAFDTLLELQEALGSDPDFAATVTNSLATKVSTTDPRLSDARPPVDHAHDVADVTGLQSALDGKAAASHGHNWSQITGKPGAFTPEEHHHTLSEVNGLAAALDGKASASHVHDVADVTGLSGTLATFVAKSGELVTLWGGTEAQYSALPNATKNAVGFYALVRP